MTRPYPAFCFLPISAALWALAVGPSSSWAVTPLTILTLGLLAFRIRAVEWCWLALLLQSCLVFFFIPCFLENRARPLSQLTGCHSRLKSISTALEAFSVLNNGKYPKSLAQLTPCYLKTIPCCPATRTDTYSMSYFSNGDAYTFFCSGEGHVRAAEPAGYPRYTSQDGLLDR